MIYFHVWLAADKSRLVYRMNQKNKKNNKANKTKTINRIAQDKK